MTKIALSRAASAAAATSPTRCDPTLNNPVPCRVSPRFLGHKCRCLARDAFDRSPLREQRAARSRSVLCVRRQPPDAAAPLKSAATVRGQSGGTPPRAAAAPGGASGAGPRRRLRRRGAAAPAALAGPRRRLRRRAVAAHAGGGLVWRDFGAQRRRRPRTRLQYLPEGLVLFYRLRVVMRKWWGAAGDAPAARYFIFISGNATKAPPDCQ